MWSLKIMIKQSFCYLHYHPLYERFIDTVLYGKQSLRMHDVKKALSSKESSKKPETKNGEGLTSKGRLEKTMVGKGRRREDPSLRIKT